ncbi:MFS transporter [Aldersonia sp. NBC_00410]|uniref:MFS transporter n=1 Tax=Aldersonia sp. NBC_00410 TaxID=2975954 RepID=UPI002259479F|nr:MFS transporter [Aldersonia sp. NBC_00410]MCX5045718.1 MFS transporter [Aldersonia sp. NBC_00410]
MNTKDPVAVMNPWRFIVAFGTVSLLADVVYEGARSVTGPLLATLGATALVVGVVTGIGEAAALLLRLVSGPLADRTRKFWAWTIAGYALTVVTVPLLGLTATLWVACALVIAERVGKAVRSPAKDTLLSFAAASTGRGRGFAVHEALDQIGALIGPLVVAGMLALTGGQYGPALGVLAAPGVAVLALLLWLRMRVPEPSIYEPTPEPDPASSSAPGEGGRRATTHRGWAAMPREFWIYAVFTSATMLGFATFGVLSFHMVVSGLIPTAWVPVIYAVVMLADAAAALATGWAYDRTGPRVLIVLPVLAIAIPVLSFTTSVGWVVIGALLWGAAVGVQESTLRAVVADLVPPDRRATAYGLFAAVLGCATAAGGALTGYLYENSIAALITTVTVAQFVAVTFLVTTTRVKHLGG